MIKNTDTPYIDPALFERARDIALAERQRTYTAVFAAIGRLFRPAAPPPVDRTDTALRFNSHGLWRGI